MLERDKKLFKKFPQLYRGKDDDPRRNRIVSGLEINKGWYELVSDLSEDIVNHCENNGYDIPKVFQVKEKFGGLRFYLENNTGDEEIWNIINRAEHKSYQICEVCGDEGTLCRRDGGHWVKTLCVNHADELEYSVLNNDLKKQVTGENVKDLTN